MPRPPLPAPLRRAASLLLLAVAGCQDLGPDQGVVVLRYHEAEPLGRGRLVATLEDRARQYYVEGIDLAAGADGWLESRPLRSAPDGDLRVRVALRSDATAPVAVVDARIPLAPHAMWRLDVFASSAAPAEACGGCTGLRRVSLPQPWRPPARDWLYLTWTSVALAGP